MPTRTSVTTFKIRLRPELKAKLERAAKKLDKSINVEMVDRLEKSFGPAELVSLGRVASDIEKAWSRFAAETHRQGLQETLMQASEALIEEHSPENIERVRNAIEAIASYSGRLPEIER